eukprot:gene101-401_t
MRIKCDAACGSDAGMNDVDFCENRYSLNYVDLPEEYEDTMRDWLQGFLALLKVQNAEFSGTGPAEGGPLQRLKTQICDNLTLYAMRYQEELAPFVQDCVTGIWELLMSLDAQECNDQVVIAALKFISAAARQNWPNSPFADVAALRSICDKVILPNIKLRDADFERFEDDAEDFLRRDIEEADQDSRRKATVELVQALMRNQEASMTEILI